MYEIKKLISSLFVLVLSSTLLAAPKAWVSTRYRPDIWSSGSWYRAPVTDGYMDVRLAIENVSFTIAEFSITYDNSILQQPGPGNILDIMSGLSSPAVTTENLEGTWKKTTFTFTGAVTIGEVQYESESVFRLRLIPLAEGTVPISLWTSSSPRFPDAYKSCSLTLRNGEEEVPFERKEWNDGVQLVTFTDKTSASVLYYYDLNLGTPISNGVIKVMYSDNSVEEFLASDHAKGITIDASYGGYYITAQPDAIQYSLIFPEYEDWSSDSISGGWSTMHIQPETMFFLAEEFSGIRATSEDIDLTVELPGIGADFAASEYDAAIITDEEGALTKTFDFEYVNDDTITLTIVGGLEANPFYSLYVYKNGLITGRAWFSATIFYPVTFTVKDQADNLLSGAKVTIPQYGMFGPSNLEQWTDENGVAVFELSGSEWGNFYDYYVTLAGHEDAVGSFLVYDDEVEVPVVMGPVLGVDMDDFVVLASQWSMEFCQWNNYCSGADRNRDGIVNMEDLVIFVDRWMIDAR